MKFRKKPVVIEAVQFIFTPERCKELADFLPDGIAPEPAGSVKPGEYMLKIPTLEGTMIAYEGWWIIKGVDGEFYPCKPDIFEKTYSPMVSARSIVSDVVTALMTAPRVGNSTDEPEGTRCVHLSETLVNSIVEHLKQLC